MADSVLDQQHGGTHYKEKPIEPWDVIKANKMGFFDGNALKYLMRFGDKGNPVEDLCKCIHYVQAILEFVFGVWSKFELLPKDEPRVIDPLPPDATPAQEALHHFKVMIEGTDWLKASATGAIVDGRPIAMVWPNGGPHGFHIQGIVERDRDSGYTCLRRAKCVGPRNETARKFWEDLQNLKVVRASFTHQGEEE